jgi:hypothetical protein
MLLLVCLAVYAGCGVVSAGIQLHKLGPDTDDTTRVFLGSITGSLWPFYALFLLLGVGAVGVEKALNAHASRRALPPARVVDR